MMKNKIVLLSFILSSMVYMHAYGGVRDMLSNVGHALFWVVKPFEVFDSKNFDATKKEIESKLPYLEQFKDVTDSQYRLGNFDPRYRNGCRYREMQKRVDNNWQPKDGQTEKDYQGKVMGIWKYGPLCPLGRDLTQCIHTKRNAYIFSGIWYVVLAAGTTVGIKKMVSYFKKRKKIRTKRMQEQCAQGCCAVSVQV